MKIIATAPGKVVVLGEYAVLEGAPALVMGVDRRVRVTLATNGESHCSVAAPGWTEETTRFHLEASGEVRFEGNGRSFVLAQHVIEEYCRWSGRRPYPPFRLVLDSGSLMEAGPGQPTKLGLGSSAALTVALCNALSYHAAMRHGGTRTPDLCTLIRIHSGLQQSRGSGLDVAASLHGGVIEYRRLPVPEARPADLPQGVEYCFIWSGKSAATGSFLAGIEQWQEDRTTQYRRTMKALGEMAETGVRAAQANDRDEFLDVTGRYAAALGDLGKVSGTDIVSEPHRRLRAVARRYGVVYKPCGAGGGDIGVGLSSDPGALAGFLAAAAADHFKPLHVNIDRHGVQTRSES